MDIKRWLAKSSGLLEQSSIATSRLDAEVLLSDELNKDRSWLQAHIDFELSIKQVKNLDAKVKRRAKHEPLAYIRGKQEFYRRDFKVSPDTLTPRPETETMIDLLYKSVYSLPFTDDSELQIIDVGTGSGCIIITANLELSKISSLKSKISYIGLDISEKALKIATDNAKNLKKDINFQHFDLLSDDILSSVNCKLSTVFLANLPYVPDDFHINLAASHEPKLAIFGGSDGLDYYRILFQKIDSKAELVLTESLPSQHKTLESIAKKFGYRLVNTEDFIQAYVPK